MNPPQQMPRSGPTPDMLCFVYGFESRQQAIERARSEGGADLHPAGNGGGPILGPGDIATTQHSSGLALPAGAHTGVEEGGALAGHWGNIWYFSSAPHSAGYWGVPRPQKAPEPPPEPIALEAPVIGYRAWKLTLGGLESQALPDVFWDKPVMKAKCRPDWDSEDEEYGKHPAPHYNCMCGLYGFYEPSKVAIGGMYPVVGAILAWGDRFFAHKEGFRAEQAKIIALMFPKEWGPEGRFWYGKPSRVVQVALQAIAEEQGVTVVPDKQFLELVAREHGDPVPPKARLK